MNSDHHEDEEAANKEQGTRDEAPSSMTDEDIERMMDEADERASEEKQKQEGNEKQTDEEATREEPEPKEESKEPAPEKPPFWSALPIKRVLLIGIPSLLLIVAVTGSALHEPAKRPPKRKVVTTRPTGTRQVAETEAEVVTEIPSKQDSAPTFAERVRTDIQRIAPRVYGAVTLEMEDGGKEGDDGSVSSIEIAVRSGQWDSLSGPARVDLLKRTNNLLSSRYPGIMRLVFDDGRKALTLRFGE